MLPSRVPLVLIADDDYDTCEMYAGYLRVAAYRVETAADGHQAFLKARALKPDVIVIDLYMPRVDGWRTLDELRKDPNTNAIPVIVLTGHDVKSLVKPAALALGVVSCFIKPYLPERLAAEIGEQLSPIASGFRLG